MVIEFILMLCLGVFFGCITGLIPGVHINTISLILISLTPFLLIYFIPFSLVIFIVSMTTTHTFLNFIPSVFLGSPDEDTALSILPGHKYLLEGRGYEAIIYTLQGSCIAIPIILILTPILIYSLPIIYQFLSKIMFFLLILSSIYLISKETVSKKQALFIFFLSGFLGFSTFHIQVENSLMPLLTGFFGSSSMITSIMKKENIPEQKIGDIRKLPKKKQAWKVAIASTFSAPLCSFLPSLGSSQAAVIGSDIVRETEQEDFLMMTGCINTVVSGVAFIALYSIGVTRTGTAAAVLEILELTIKNIPYILLAIVLSSILSVFIAVKFSKMVSNKINKINYQALSISVLVLLCIITISLSGFLGFYLFIISTFTGLTCILLKIRRSNLMGSLMIPTILIYLPF